MALSLCAKSEFFYVLVRFHTFVCNQFYVTVKVFQSDGGIEFVNSRVMNLCLCIVFIIVYLVLIHLTKTIVQNVNIVTFLRLILSMMLHANAPASLWFDVFATTVFVINRFSCIFLGYNSLHKGFSLLYSGIFSSIYYTSRPI